jgi:hypothetical protein
VLFFIAGLLFHAIETLDARRNSEWPPQRDHGFLEVQASYASHD